MTSCDWDAVLGVGDVDWRRLGMMSCRKVVAMRSRISVAGSWSTRIWAIEERADLRREVEMDGPQDR